MTFRHQLLATVLAALLAAPSWPSAGMVVGVAGPSRDAIVRGVAMSYGTTLFDADVVTVNPGGVAIVSFGQDSIARLGEETTLRLAKDSNRVTFELMRGRVIFRSSEKLPVEGRVADATIRSANGLGVRGGIVYLSANRVAVIAQKGSLLVATAHDAHNISLREGESVLLRLDAAQDQEGRTAGSTPPTSREKKAAIIIATIILGAGLATLAIEESLGGNKVLVSPFQFP